MLPSRARFTKTQVTIVSDLSDGKSRTIQTARDDAPRTAAAFTQREIAKRVALPTRHRLQDRIGGEMFPARRRIERDPSAQRSTVITAILRSDNTRKRETQ